MRILRWLKKIFNDSQHGEDLTFFRHVSIFHGLTTRQLGRVKQAMQKRFYRTGERLFSEGQIGKAVFILKSGQVELSRRLRSGKETSLGVLGPGQVFGEMALLEQKPRTANATVVEDGDIYLLYTATLESLIRHYPAIGVKIIRNMAILLSALLRKTNKELERHTKSFPTAAAS